ncbi:MAG: DUF362 domain-containing protein [candidate division Zixibacteria bacterium]|nr:DUF362 domain-containing protein [candidate division Zixibacteria bacterium]
MKRRDFIKSNAAAILAGCLPFNNLLANTVKSVVWEVAGASIESFTALFARLGGLEKFIKSDITRATILIKPNICLPLPPSSATTTSPSAIEGLCEYLIEAGAKRIIIADHTLQDTDRFNKILLHEIAGTYPEVKLVLANEQRYYSPVGVNGKELKQTEIMKLVRKADLLINMPTAKHHSATHVSLATKNLMGMIWDRAEFHTGLDLHQAIGDLTLAIRPQLNIIDAGRILLNGGPTGPGPIINENRLFASTDIVAVDALVASRYDFGGKSFPPDQIAHLRAAYQNGVGELDLDNIELKQIELE